MKKEIHILMVDDHQTIIEGHQHILNTGLDHNLVHASANNCDLAWEKINSENYDLVFLDISFPVRPDSKFTSGEELGQKIKQEYPEIKIIILTGTEDVMHLADIFFKINPNGFLLKTEINSKEITRCVEMVLEGSIYHSRKISKLVRSRATNPYSLDEFDHKILHHLSLSAKTKDLPQHIPLSLGAIEKRKKRLKEVFGVDNLDNEALLKKAREAGYL